MFVIRAYYPGKVVEERYADEALAKAAYKLHAKLATAVAVDGRQPPAGDLGRLVPPGVSYTIVHQSGNPAHKIGVVWNKADEPADW